MKNKLVCIPPLVNEVEKYLYSKVGGYLAYLLFFLMILSTLWLFYEFINDIILTQAEPDIAFSSPILPQADLQGLARLHLFGEYQMTDSAVLPETALNLQLLGTFVATPNDHSIAVISMGGGSQKLYHQGDVLYDNIVVQSILADRVILNNQGHLEILLLPKPSLVKS